MKKLIPWVFVIIFCVNVPPVHSAEKNKGPVDKLTRGVVNVVTSPVEIPKNVRAYWIDGSEKTSHILVWIFSGAVKGVAETVKRAGSGVWDIVTFPVEKPVDYEPLLKPDSVFDDWPTREKAREE